MLAKFISCECYCKIDEKKGNSNQKLNNDKCWYECKKHHIWKRLYLESCSCSCKIGKYLASIIDDSVITCDKIIEETKTKKAACRTRNVYILPAFLLINVVLLTDVSIYCYLIKYKSKQIKYTLIISNKSE